MFKEDSLRKRRVSEGQQETAERIENRNKRREKNREKHKSVISLSLTYSFTHYFPFILSRFFALTRIYSHMFSSHSLASQSCQSRQYEGGSPWKNIGLLVDLNALPDGKRKDVSRCVCVCAFVCLLCMYECV